MRSVTAVLDSIGIEWVDHGPNIRKGNVAIRCPFCGDGDPSKHMSINLESGLWGCWRSGRHVGRRFSKLVATLAHCTFEEAEKMVTEGLTTGISFASMLHGFQSHDKPKTKPQRIELNYPNIRGVLGEPYLDYLCNRGYSDPEKLVDYYDMRRASHGPFKGRIILPVYSNGLKGWTARSIMNKEPRYLAHPEGPLIRRNLFNHDRCLGGGRKLIIVEGPFDAVSVDWYLRKDDICAVSLMGIMATGPQVELLLKLSRHFDNTVIMLDKSATAEAINLSRHLPGVSTQIINPTAKDPGDMKAFALKKLLAA